MYVGLRVDKENGCGSTPKNDAHYLEPLTSLIDIILALPELLCMQRTDDVRILTDNKRDFGHDDQLVPRDIVLADRLPNHLLALSVAVRIGRVPGVDAMVIRGFQDFKRRLLVEQPRYNAGTAAQGHSAEDGPRDFQAGVTQVDIVNFGVVESLQCRGMERRIASHSTREFGVWY